MNPLLSFVLAAFALTYVAADETTLVVPFVDPQAISAKVVGVDAANTRTTYELFQGAYTGTWSDPEGSFPGTATLVEGADYASFTYVVNDPEDGSFTIGGVCSLGNGQEACVGEEDDPTGPATATTTDSAVPFGLEIDASTTGTPASATPGSSGSGGSQASNTGSSGTGSAPSTSPSSGAIARISVAVLPVFGALGTALLLC